MRFTVGSASDVGQLRTLNEDSWFTGSDLFAVADGMGGHRGGEVASAEALDALRDAFHGSDLDELMAAVQSANQSVFDKAQADPELSGMGTTLCAVALIRGESGQSLGVVNVGDSRVYLHSGGQLTQLSEDHSFVEALVRDGRLTRAQADVHPQRNVLTRALGIEPEVQIDAWLVTPRSGDRFLLCSDGLFNEMSDDELADVLAANSDPSAAAIELVARANASGGRDNITCVIVDVEVDGESGEMPGDVTDATERVSRQFDPADDLAAFDEEQLSAVADAAVSDAVDALQRTPETRAPHSSRWRSVVFVGAVVATLALAFGAITWAARNTYYVGFDRGQVVIYQGRPGGLLWFDPTVSQRTGIKKGDVDQAHYDEINKGKVESSLAQAKVYVANLLGSLPQVDPVTGQPTTSTTTVTTTVTKTVTTTTISDSTTTAVVSTTAVTTPGP